MDKHIFEEIKQYMLECMHDSAHDTLHIYRVLGQALKIAKNYPLIDYDVLITSCLLHDIGRDEQFENPKLDHAIVGAEKAAIFLNRLNWDNSKIEHVKNCIYSHRWRNDITPETIEAKILFDSDKLDACGAMGICRSLIYKGQVGEPLYSVDTKGRIIQGKEKNAPESFFKEYHKKLIHVYDQFYTEEAKKIAEFNKSISIVFFENLESYVYNINEIQESELKKHLS